jgi:hypothetical protein
VDGTNAEAITQLYSTLQRYAGWLDRERPSTIVRADVQALGTALDTRTDPLTALQALDTNIARLRSGDLRKMLRVVVGQMRRALQPVERD